MKLGLQTANSTRADASERIGACLVRMPGLLGQLNAT
jgi:hypothetical protein